MCNRMTVVTADGVSLRGDLFESERFNSKVVIIASATGVPRHYYRKYAEFLARAGYHVMPFDYRGIGESRPQRLRKMDRIATAVLSGRRFARGAPISSFCCRGFRESLNRGDSRNVGS